jgi:hypothetical protein
MQMSRIKPTAERHFVRQPRTDARSTSFIQGRQAMHIMRTVTSTPGSFRSLAIIGASLMLAACGSSQNWEDSSPNASVGGTVTGLTGTTLALWNNGGDRLAVAGNGRFTFPLQIAHGSDYTVIVAAQPEGQTCTVTNGSGKASGNVTNITVTCQAYSFVRRPLPAIYSTGKAVNYSPYRTAGGPITFEVPSDAEILQDLRLLDVAGFNLLRLFGAKAPATDVVAEKILRIAAQNYPDMKFQLGLDLKGLTSCSDPANDFNISYLISNLSKYPNVIAISVGNETSFFSKFMPLPCLEGYIRTIRAQVTQPVTADDDWTFYAGKSGGGGDRVPVKPDTILPLIDFAAIHMYPFSYTVWDWRQAGIPEGPARAQAMMETSLVALKEWYGEVVAYRYVGTDGVTVSVGDSMPVVVGETGWKARQTNPAAEIEQFAALPANAKWYFDLLYGNPGGYPSWQGSVGGPPTIFYFQAFDEQWKGIDDGWGLWDISRRARYALCGLLPAGPVCQADLYAGAGYFVASAFSTVTFDSPTTNYALLGFGGAEDSQVVADPIGGANKVARVNRSATALTFAGTVVGTAGLTVGTIPFDAANTRMTVRVYSPTAGIPVRLKVEDSTDPADPKTRSVETESVTTVANAWETLTFDFANPAAGTPALNPAYNYDSVIIFFNFGTTGATAGAATYYFDDLAFIGGGGTGGGGGGGSDVPFSDLSFDSSGLIYTLTGFGGAEDSSLQLDPADASNTVVRVNRSATAQTFAGTVVSTGPNLTAGTIPFDASNTRMTVQVYSPGAGIPVRLKIEDSADPETRFVETEAVTTKANEWETLTFDFANPASGSPALNLAHNYDRVIIFFNFGASGEQAGAQTYYFDDIVFVAGGGGGGGVVGESGNTGTCSAPCIDFAGTVGYTPFEGLVSAEQAFDPVDATNQVAKFVKGPDGAPWAGATIYTVAANQSVPEFDLSTSKVVTLRVYAPAAGLTVRLKLEDAANNGIYLEKDVLTTKANEWETLSFDFATPVNGVYNAANTYNRVSIFPVFSITAPPASEVTFYFDELKYTTTDGGGGGGSSGDTGTCTDAACIDFSEPGIGFGPFENGGGGTVAIVDDPNNAANKVVQFVKKPGDGEYFGTTITGLGGSVVLTPTEKTVTMRVFSPAAGTNFLLKFEGGTGGPATTEKDAATTVAGAWETLSFVMPDAGTYTTVVLFPNGRSSVAADKTMLVDELRFPALSTGGGGGGGAALVFASNYTQLDPLNWRSAEGGDASNYIDTSVATQYWWNGVASADATPNFYFGYGISINAKPWGFGAYVKAPGNGTASVIGKTNLKLAAWGNDELVNTNPTLTLILMGPSVGGCTSELKGSVVVAAAGVQNYTVALSSFTLQTPCAYASAAAALDAGVTEVHVQVLGDNVQYVNGGPVDFANGLNVGPISFE